MAQIDSYLKRLAAENGLNYLDDFLDLYDFIPNEDLKTLLAVYHTQLNHWFAVLNHDINSQYDDEGNICLWITVPLSKQSILKFCTLSA